MPHQPVPFFLSQSRCSSYISNAEYSQIYDSSFLGLLGLPMLWKESDHMLKWQRFSCSGKWHQVLQRGGYEYNQAKNRYHSEIHECQSFCLASTTFCPSVSGLNEWLLIHLVTERSLWSNFENHKPVTAVWVDERSDVHQNKTSWVFWYSITKAASVANHIKLVLLNQLKTSASHLCTEVHKG